MISSRLQCRQRDNKHSKEESSWNVLTSYLKKKKWKIKQWLAISGPGGCWLKWTSRLWYARALTLWPNLPLLVLLFISVWTNGSLCGRAIVCPSVCMRASEWWLTEYHVFNPDGCQVFYGSQSLAGVVWDLASPATARVNWWRDQSCYWCSRTLGHRPSLTESSSNGILSSIDDGYEKSNNRRTLDGWRMNLHFFSTS